MLKKKLLQTPGSLFRTCHTAFHYTLLKYACIHVSSFPRSFHYTDAKRKNVFPNVQGNNKSRTICNLIVVVPVDNRER